MWSLLMIIYVLSEENLKDFETLYLTQSERVVLNLHDYFSQNEISFYITNTNMTNNNAILKHDSYLNLLSFMPTKSSKNSKNYDKTFPFFNLLEGTFFIWYEDREIFAYLFTNNNTLINIWKLKVNENVITQAVIFKNDYGFTIALATKICENIKHNHCLNEIYFIRVKEFMKPENPRKLNLWDIRYANDLKISGTLTDHYFIVFGRFRSGKQILFFYQLKYPDSYFLIYSFGHYIESGEFKDTELNLIDVQFYHDQLFLLDHELGLFIYSFHNLFFEIRYKDFYDFRNYGKSHSMAFSVTAQPYLMPLMISTDAGIIFTLPRILNSEFSWINTYDAFNTLLPFHSMEFCNNKLFLQVEANKSHYLMIYDYDKILNEYIEQNIVNFNLESLVGDDFDPNGFWILICKKNDYFYIRNDAHKIKVFSLIAKDWSLEIIGNNSFFIEITGKSNNKAKKPVKKYLNVISFEPGSYEIYESSQSHQLIENGIDVYFKHSEEIVEMKLDSLVCGPNLTYSIESYNFSGYTSIELLMPNLNNLTTQIILPKNIKSQILYANLFIYMVENDIFIKDLNENTTQLLSIETNVIKFIWVENIRALITLGTDENLKYIISIFLINLDLTYFIVDDFQIDINCLIFKSDNKGIFTLCSDREIIYVYRLDTQSKFGIFNKNNLNLDDDLWITDIELLYKYISLSDNKLFLFVTCNYGIILIDISIIYGENEMTFSHKVFNNFPKSIQRILIFDDTIFAVFPDSKIGVYDSSLKILKFLGPHFKGAIEDIYISKNTLVLQVGNEIAIYDWFKFSHNALIKTKMIEESCKLISNEEGYQVKKLYTLCKFHDNSILNLYEYRWYQHYIQREYGCTSPVSINFEINQKNLKLNDLQEGEILILAKNQFFQKLRNIKVNLHINQNQIWIDNSKFPKILEIPYDKRDAIILSSVLLGKSIQASMLINNIPYENIDINYSPVYFQNNFDEISSVKVPFNEKFFHWVFISNKLIINRANELTIYKYNNYTLSIESIIKYSNYIDGTNIICKSIDAIQLNENIFLIFTICDYSYPIEFLWNENTKISAQMIASLFAIEYDCNRNISNRSLLIGKINSHLRVKSIKLNDNRFEIFLYEDIKFLESCGNNFIFRYKGIWDKNLFKIEKMEKIDYFSLGIHEFTISSLDIIYSEFSEIFLYIVDSAHGFSIIRIQENLPAENVWKLQNPSYTHFFSLSHCEKMLLIFTDSNDIYKYSIADPSNPKFIKLLHVDSYKGLPSPLYNKFVAFQDDCSFIAFINPSFIKTSLDIWNNDEYFEITKYQIDTHTDIIFLEKNIIAIADIEKSKLMICSLNKRFIEIPAISKEKFKKIEKKWGTDEFQIQLYAENLNETVYSEVMILKRGKPDAISSTSWWLWICIGSIILILAATICVVMLMKMKKKKEIHNYTEVGLMMEEINYKK